MPPKTTITSERARELGRRGAAAVDRAPGTGRFVKRAAGDRPPAPPPAADPPPSPPAGEPETPAPSFRMARSLFGRRRRQEGGR